MIKQKIKSLMDGSFSLGMAVLLVFVIILVLSILPAIILLCVNQLGGSEFHINHSLLNYFALWVLIIISSALK